MSKGERAKRLLSVLRYEPETGHFYWTEKVNKHLAIGTRAGTTDKKGYRQIGYKKELFQEGRLAWLAVHGDWPDDQIDHRDCDKANNKISNLRRATPSQNSANTRPRPGLRSGLKGAYYHNQCGKYCARIKTGGRMYHLGIFKTAEEAHAAYCAKAKELFGEFARTS